MTPSQARHFKRHGRLNNYDRELGLRGLQGLKCCCIWLEDCTSEDGKEHKKGDKKTTWEVMKSQGIHNYNIEENKVRQFESRSD